MGGNPISYADPDGGFIHIVIGGAIGGVGNLLYQGFTGNINSIGDGFAAFGIGAGAGALGAATGGASLAAMGTASTLGGAIGAGALSGAVGGATAGLVQGTGNAMYFGNQNFGDAFTGAGLQGALYGGIGGAVFGGIGGGIAYKPGGAAAPGGTVGTVADDAINIPADDILMDGYRAQFPDILDDAGNVIHKGGVNITKNTASVSKMSNSAAREWYNAQLGQLSQTYFAPTRQGALMAHTQRNALKIQARQMMADRNAAKLLDQTNPIRSFDYYINKYGGQGLQGEALWNRIIQGSHTPNAGVNLRFGIK